MAWSEVRLTTLIGSNIQTHSLYLLAAATEISGSRRLTMQVLGEWLLCRFISMISSS